MMYNGKSRHIRRRHNTVRELLSSGIITVDYVKSKDNVSDPLTKGLSREGVERTSKGMDLRPRTSQHGVVALISSMHFTSNQPLIVTGHSLGGSVASLFTLWLLDSLPRYGVQQLLCITFGSPLLGNSGFQKSISEHPTWSSCFLHVVSDKDPVPGFLISDHNASAANVTTPTCYVPFGTYLFCSESGFSCFEEPQSILELLMIMRSRCAESENLDNCSQENINLSNLATNIAERAEVQAKHKQKVFDPSKINITKKSMSYLEWYMKNSLEEAGYYDKYKTRRSRSRDDIESTENLIKHHRTLKLFWKRIVTEVENLPWKEGRTRRMRLLYAATSYQRMVEPLDIAEYYGRGKRDYVNHGRSEHYKLLEKWFKLLEKWLADKYTGTLPEKPTF
ncbi:hypothetical protein T459_32279 [Capsicum annuum]|uniref:Fungal lipase-like domain-containing protein n=1 Tax=Capsicum annuum TaxID=4072 RepID=A0A2G2Y2B5_CAPAN|nr:hypothetical protein T459_32279 [Capsicum annuum]